MGPCLSKSANAPDSTTHPDTSSSKESENKESPHPTPDPHSKTATNSKIVVSELDETQRKDLPTNQSEHQSTNTLTVSPTTPMKDDRSNSSVWNMSNIDHEHEHKVQHSPINTRLDLDVRESRLMFQLKMQMEAAEEKFERERIEERMLTIHLFPTLYPCDCLWCHFLLSLSEVDTIELSKISMYRISVFRFEMC